MKHTRTAAWLLVTAVVASLVAPASAQTNLLTNPGFEESGGSYDGWDTFGEGVQLSLPDGDNIIRTGAAAAKIYGEFIGCPENPQFDVGGAFQAFTPTAGMEYTFSGYSFVSSADTIPGSYTCDGNRLIAKIVYFDAASGGNEMSSNEIILGDWRTPRDEWIPFSLSAPVPAGALRVQAMFLFLQPGCDEGAVFVDDCSFVEASPTVEPNILGNPSFDTNLSQWTTFGNVYHDSRSFAVHTTTGSAKMYSTFDPEFPDSGIYQIKNATSGGIWKLDVHVMTTCVESPITVGNDNFVMARIVFLDSGDAEIGFGEEVILDEDAPLGTWTKHTVLGEAPTGTESVAVYVLFISPTQADGAAWIDDVSLSETDWVGVPSETVVPGLTLYQNTPNPFGPSTRIDFELARSGDVGVDVYNLAGRRVATLLSGELEAGPHSVTWNGRTADGSLAAAGMYWYVVRTGDGQESRSMVLVK